MSSPTLIEYLREFSGHEGFFSPMAMATWDFLLTAQNLSKISGGMLEIGVFRGKSGILSAMYMNPEEPCFFLDIHDVPIAKKAIESKKPSNNHFLKMNSINALSDPRLIAMRGKLRWIHIDGEHTGYSTREDLRTASELLGEGGIICVDDFFNFKYPQLTAAVYSFLLENQFRYHMIMAASNKCYICQSSWVDFYDSYIRDNAISFMELDAKNWTLTKTSYLFDYGCYSVIQRNKDRSFVGLDKNIDAIVF